MGELTMAMALSLDMELSVTVATMVAMLAMEVSITASTANVKLTVILMPTIGQVATGHAYGVVTGVDYGHGLVSGYGAIGNRGYAGYGGFYGGYRGYYGKREADSDAYTIGQVAHGLPVANAYATAHPHNVGVITGVGYSGYGGYAGYGGYHHLGFYGKREADSDA